MSKFILSFITALLISTQTFAQVFNWGNSCTTFHFNPIDVRDPTIVYNNTSLPNWGACPGYDNTAYAFTPCNWQQTTAATQCQSYNYTSGPNIGQPVPAIYTCPASWVDIGLAQFNVPATAKQIFVGGRAGTTGPHMWQIDGTQQIWFRAPGSNWLHSPAWQVGYLNDLGVIPVPVALVGGVPTMEIAWALSTSLVLAPNPNPDTAWLNLILLGYCE